ncbi:MAG: glycosyltransferase family 4 protein [Geobacter sp.]|nr:glycosyltransferase family 4 protein [Geobacter sp.]
MRIAFCVYGFTADVTKLQPWLTILHVANYLSEHGWDVHILTDADTGNFLDGINIHVIDSLRATNKEQVWRMLNVIGAECCVVLTTPLNLVSSGWYQYLPKRLVAFLSYPFYTNSELLRALPHLTLEDIKTYYRHALIPRVVWAGNLRRYFKSVVAQSPRTANRVADAASAEMMRYAIPAGIDLDVWKPCDLKPELPVGNTRYLYLGWTKAIRGFDVLVRAFRDIAGPDTELLVLARGATDEELAMTQHRLAAAGLDKSVRFIGGWMSQEDLRSEISQASVVVLPFVLVPSELPVSVMECIACGTPVIGTDIDGLPDAIGKAGMVVRSGSVGSLSEAMLLVHKDREALARMRAACVESRNNMMSWRQVSAEWMQILQE